MNTKLANGAKYSLVANNNVMLIVRYRQKFICCYILTTNLAAVVCVFVCAQNLTNFFPHALISNPYVPKILFA